MPENTVNVDTQVVEKAADTVATTVDVSSLIGIFEGVGIALAGTLAVCGGIKLWKKYKGRKRTDKKIKEAFDTLDDEILDVDYEEEDVE